MSKKWTVGRVGDHRFTRTEHDSELESEQRIEAIKTIDPKGVFNGDYYLDRPEGWEE